MSNAIVDAIAILDQAVPNARQGLPDPVFYYVSRMTPLINVDLLIKDEANRTLLAWRDDRHAGKGWHLPGGIIRFRETMEERLEKVAQTEVGTKVAYHPVPIAVNQIFCHTDDERGHFISLLYRCFLPSSFVPDNGERIPTNAGYLAWHTHCPSDLLAYQDLYAKYL